MNRHIIYAAAFFFIIISCNQVKKPSGSDNLKSPEIKTVTLEEYESEQLNSGIKKDTIIEGLVFGMSPKQTTKILNELKKDKKVKDFVLNGEGNQISALYNAGINDYKLEGLMNLKFLNNKLYYCQIIFKQKLNKSVTLYTISSDFLNLFQEAYGDYQFKSGGAGTIYIWVTGNRKVSIGDIQDPDDPYYAIEYQEIEKMNDSRRLEQENINKNKPKL